MLCSKRSEIINLYKGLLARHCVLASMESIVTVTPHENARVVVDGIPIRETYMLENQAAIILGQVNVNNNS